MHLKIHALSLPLYLHALAASAQSPEQHRSTDATGPRFIPGNLNAGVTIYNRTDYNATVKLHWSPNPNNAQWFLRLFQTRDGTFDPDYGFVKSLHSELWD